MPTRAPNSPLEIDLGELSSELSQTDIASKSTVRETAQVVSGGIFTHILSHIFPKHIMI